MKTSISLQRLLVPMLLMSSFMSIGQTSQLPTAKVTMPEAAKIIRYQDYPVDYSTGLPDITIPLWEVKIGDITVPITLKYHASGFRPAENHDIIGLGWSLFAAPAFTQTVKGGKDGLSRFNNSFEENLATLQGLESGALDEQSDLYHYRLGAHSGTALWDQDRGRLVSYPFNNTTIHRQNNTYYSIVDPEGIRYNFYGLKESTGSYQAPTDLSLMCTDISSMNNNKNHVGFTYNTIRLQHNYVRPEYVSFQADGMDPYSKKLTITVANTSTNKKWVYESKPSPTTGEPVYRWESKGVIGGKLGIFSKISIRDLKTITTDHESVTFSYMNQSYKAPYGNTSNVILLRGIRVKSLSDNKEVRNIEFHHSSFCEYFPRLDSITITTGSSNTKQIYAFGYETNGGIERELTERMEQIDQYTDQFGFFNTSPPPFYHFKYIYAPATKEVHAYVRGGNNPEILESGMVNPQPFNHQSALLFTLNKITIPTGGTIEYLYEPNVGKCAHTEVIAGLRVASITEKNKGEVLIRKRKFEYINDEGSPSGKIYRPLKDHYFFTSKTTDFNGHIYELYNIYRSPIEPIGYNKAPVLYEKVTEYTYTDATQAGYKIDRYYTTHCDDSQSDIRMGDVNTGITNIRDILFQLYYGLLSKENHYEKKSNQQYFLKKELVNTYNYNYMFGYQGVRNRQFYHHRLIYDIEGNKLLNGASTESAADYMFLNDDSLRTEHIELWEQATRYFNEQGDILSVVCDQYKYKPYSRRYATSYHSYPIIHNKLSTDYYYEEEGKIVTEGAQGFSLRTTGYSYPLDLSDYPIKPDFISFPLQVNDSTNGRFVKQVHFDYRKISIDELHEQTAIKKVRTYFDPLKQDSTVVYYDSYDDYGNVLQTHKQNYPNVVLHWGHNSYIVAQLENYTLSQLNANLQLKALLDQLQGYKDEFVDPVKRASLSALNIQIRALIPNVKITTYTYRPYFGVTSLTDPNCKTIYYEYDNWQQLKNIRNQSYQIEQSDRLHIQK